MTQVYPLTKNLDSFCEGIFSEYSILNVYIDVSQIDTILIAKKFIKYFRISYPLSLQQLIEICQNAGIIIETCPRHHKSRGYNFLYKGIKIICIRKGDNSFVQMHSILHELYEIIFHKLRSFNSFQVHWNRSWLERQADVFTAYIQLPHDDALKWINKNGIDVCGLVKRFNCSYKQAIKILYQLLPLIEKRQPMLSLFYKSLHCEKNLFCKKTALQFAGKSSDFWYNMKSEDFQYQIFSLLPEKGAVTLLEIIKYFAKPRKNILFPDLWMETGEFMEPVVLLMCVTDMNANSIDEIIFHLIPKRYDACFASINNLEIISF